MAIWNPWHGCHKFSPGCMNCYVYRRDESIGHNANEVVKNKDFNLPIRRDHMGGYIFLPKDEVYACMTSDFFLEDADSWRDECWKMIKKRSDLSFTIITKRIHRFSECLPQDWADGYKNVTICCTCENQEQTDRRVPVFLELPIQHRTLIHEPMLGPIDISKYLTSGKIEKVVCGGESGSMARCCNYDWILSVRRQCIEADVSFYFKQTGAVFQKDGRQYRIPRADQLRQAQKAGINYSSSKFLPSSMYKEEVKNNQYNLFDTI